VIFDVRKTLQMILSILRKSGEAEDDREDEDEDVDDAVEGGRASRLE
jgi:hypothetical protein